MKNNNFYLWSTTFLFSLSFLFSCQHQEKELSYTRSEFKVIYHNNLDRKKTPLYGLNYFYSNDTTFISFINHQNLRLVIMNFNIPNKSPFDYKLNDSIFNIDKYGPIYATSKSSNHLAFFQDKRFGIYDLQRNKILFQKPTEGSDSLPLYLVNNKIPLKYNNKTKEAFIESVDYREKEKKYAYDSEFHYKINWETGQWELLPIKFPPSWGNGELGMRAFVTCEFKGDSIFYNFSTEPDIYLTNLKTNETEKIPARSSYHHNIKALDSTEISDTDKNFELMAIDFLYTSFFYDKFKNCYYRLYEKKQNLQNEDGLFNTREDKTIGVLVLDSDFNKIGKIDLPYKKADSFVISDRGICYITRNYDEDGKIKYECIDIEI